MVRCFGWFAACSLLALVGKVTQQMPPLALLDGHFLYLLLTYRLFAVAESEGRDGGNDNDVDDDFDDDEELVKGMARLFCEVAEAYIQLVLSAQPDVSTDIELTDCAA